MALLGSVLIGILTVVLGATSLSERNEQLTNATEVARWAMEAIKERGFTWPPKAPERIVFDGAADRPTPPVKGFPPEPYPFVERGGVRYFLNVSVLDLSRTVKAIRVIVRWGAGAEVSFETYLHP